jgi:hypothetical protein
VCDLRVECDSRGDIIRILELSLCLRLKDELKWVSTFGLGLSVHEILKFFTVKF